MGMINYVKGKYKLGCCGKEVDGWQTKSAYIKLTSGDEAGLKCNGKTIDPKEVEDIYFSHFCDECQKSTEHRFLKGKMNGTKVFWYYNKEIS